MDENKRLVAVNEQQARKITELEIVKPCPHANTINNLTNEVAKFQSKLHTLNSAKPQIGPKIQQASGNAVMQANAPVHRVGTQPAPNPGTTSGVPSQSNRAAVQTGSPLAQ